ncbi:MAG TPA: hypothetical protein VJS37_01205 [Terriglobales bacterium]|nr:hypothetical protein [Terriglobales bacterium]
MTYVAAFECKGGIVLCADTQETHPAIGNDPTEKEYVEKLYVPENLPFPIAVGGAGVGEPIEAFSLELFERLEKHQPTTVSELRLMITESIEEVHRSDGEQYRITTEGFHGSRRKARVKTYGDVLNEYEFHPGSKSADSQGTPSGKQTIGLLQRRHIRVGQIIYIGKESNRVEEAEAGTIHSAQAVYTEYPDPRRNEWETKVLPALRRFPARVLMRLTNKSATMLKRTLAGQSQPRPRSRALLKAALHRIGAL